MPTRTIYLSDDLDGAVRAVAEAMDGDENRSTVIQEALREHPSVRAALGEDAADVDPEAADA